MPEENKGDKKRKGKKQKRGGEAVSFQHLCIQPRVNSGFSVGNVIKNDIGLKPMSFFQR